LFESYFFNLTKPLTHVFCAMLPVKPPRTLV
jgi:hypothetical protein